MDKNLITLIIVVVVLALAGLLAIIAWAYWPELKAAHRWSQVQKAHKLPNQNLNTGKSSVFGSRIKSKNS